MTKYRVAISTSSFGENNPKPIKMLEDAGVEVINNPYKRRLTESEIIDHLKDIDALIAGVEPLTRKVLMSTSRLKVIARVGIGIANVDLNAAKELGIKVSNTPDGPTKAVAEMTIAALLSLCRNIIPANEALHSGKWQKMIGLGLIGAKVFFIGYGRIGRRVGELLKPFGADILVYDPFINPNSLKLQEKLVSLEDGLREAEVITLHAIGKDPILKKEEFNKMHDGVILLNSARGELVDENALVDALQSKKIKAAWLDVFLKEPYHGHLIQFKNVLLTPHIATYTCQCRLSMEVAAVKNLIQDLELDIITKKIGR